MIYGSRSIHKIGFQIACQYSNILIFNEIAITVDYCVHIFNTSPSQEFLFDRSADRSGKNKGMI